MELDGKVAVITGGANGIGEALAQRFVAEGARVVVADIEDARVQSVAREIGGVGVAADVTLEQSVREVARVAQDAYGRVDLWLSNAGVSGPPAPGELPTDDVWNHLWRLHVMSHVYAVRAVLPAMLERQSGYLFQTVSNAGLGIQPDKAAYMVTKHASIALGEWLALQFRRRGVGVSCFCPGGMLTRMLLSNRFPDNHAAMVSAMALDEVAELVVAGIRSEKFMILTRAEDPNAMNTLLARYEDYDGWIATLPHHFV